MKILCDIIAGSHLYGLSTPESDVDQRGVFINTEPSKILGLSRQEVIKKNTSDTVYFEMCHFLSSLKKTNTQMVELLFAPIDKFSVISHEFQEIRNNRFELIDSVLFYKSLVGYIYNERRLANGERTGTLGSKRKSMVDKYGFSPKNFSHLFRLAFCGTIFFEKNYYPVNLTEEDTEFRNFVFSIKTQPERYTKEHLNTLVDKAISKLEIVFNKRSVSYSFNIDLANEFCRQFYLPYLMK
jgi:predicted nucleotidyltransferase